MIALFLGGVVFGRALVKRELRHLIEGSRGNENLLAAVRRRASPDFAAADILRVYPRAGVSPEYLGQISWFPPMVPVPFLGSAPREGRSANATINRHHFRDKRPDYGPKAAGEVRVFLTGGSVVYGTGAASQEETIAGFLEEELNRDAASEKRRYVVINTGVPGNSSTHERLLVELKVVHLQPDLVLMLSGGNDIHWAVGGFDVRSLRNYGDVHFETVLSSAYDLAGLAWPAPPSVSAQIPEPAEVARRLCVNVAAAATAAHAAGARLVFALQPNLRTTRKSLSPREARVLAGMPGGGHWDPCFAEIRAVMSLRSRDFTFVDLSPAFPGAPPTEEWFIDSYHFGPQGCRELAASLAPVVREALGKRDGGPL